MKILSLLAVVITASAQSWSGLIDSSRAIDWTAVGVTGDIPVRTTICATLSSGATLTQINSAIAACASGGVVKLNVGTYTIDDSIQLKAGVTLRGAGIGQTVIAGSASALNSNGLIGPASSYDYYLGNSTSYGLTSPSRGDTTIMTATNHNWSAGDYIHIDQLEDTTGSTVINVTGGEGFNNSGACRTGTSATTATCRPVGQTVRIVSIPAANQAVVDRPLWWTYNKTPQATKVTGFLSGAGVEDLTLDNATSHAQQILHMGGWQESWALRVEMINVVSYGILMYGSARNTVRSCYIHGGNSGTGGGYTIMLYNRATSNLFEDNIVTGLGIVALMDGAIAGNVFAYNYATNMIYGNNSAGTGIGSHAAHPFFNLFEGNQLDTRFRWDYTWGTTSHQTMFRNRVVNDTNPAVDSMRNLIDVWAYAMNMNVIGNVLGTAGQETVYAETTGTPNQNARVVYATGELSLFGSRGADGGAALSTIYRQGNWDSVNNAVRWDEDIVNTSRTLPNSLYLSTKPSYFGSCAWPPIGSDLTPMAIDIPAKRRYDSSPCTTGTAPTITTASPLAVGSVGVAYSLQFSATGDAATWTTTGVPAGMVLSTSGLLSGAPGAVGPFTLVVTATNATSSDTKSFVLQVVHGRPKTKVSLTIR